MYRTFMRAAVVLLVALTTLAVLPTPAAQAADRAFAPRFTTNDTGDIDIFGNTVMTCATTATGCQAARSAGVSSSADSAVNNNAFAMVYVDVDNDASTFNSSQATVSIPTGADVLFAGLYWGGEVERGASGSAAPSPGARGTVKLRAPGAAAYSTITASTVDDGDIIYQGFADITSRVAAAGNGVYTVANVQTATGGDRLGGWTIVVAYRDTSQPARNLTVFDGLRSISGSGTRTVTVSGFQTPPAGTVNTTVGFVTYEGDLGLVGDGASLNGRALGDAQHPAGNFFNSRSSRNGVLRTGANPSYANNLGFEHSMLTVGNSYISNGASSATIGLSTSGDVYAPGVVTFATDLYAPRIDQTKTVQDLDGGAVEQGDVLRYTIAGTNTGQDGAAGFVLRDAIPADTTYVPGSLRQTQVTGPVQARTDAAGDDLAEYDAAANRVVARFGTGATATAGGTVGVGQSYRLVFDVVVNGPGAVVPRGTTITNTATASFASASLGTALTAQSTAAVTVAGPDLRLVKSHTGALVKGTQATFRLAVDNVGDARSQGAVTVRDTLPPGLTYVSAAGTGWTCSFAAGTLTCTRADSLAAGSAYPPISLVVGVDDGAPAQVANTASVSGGGDGIVDNNASVDAAPTVAVTDLSLTKAATPTAVAVGGRVTYALEVTNRGPSRSTGSTVVDTLPAGLLFVSGDAGCTSGATASTVLCEVGPLASGASEVLRVTVEAAPGSAGRTLTNSATVSSFETDPDATNDSASAPVVVRPVDLAITSSIAGDPASLAPGQSYTWALDVTNLGGSPAADGAVRFSVPAGVTIDAAALDPRCALDGPTAVVCTVGTVGPGAVVPTIRVTARVDASGAPATIDAFATVTTTEPDVAPGNNAATTSTPVGAVAQDAALAITKSVEPARAAPGDTVTYRITVSNPGPAADARDVVITDALPAGVTVVSVDDRDCAVSGSDVRCALGTLVADDTRTVVVRATVDPVARATSDASHQVDVTKAESHLGAPAATTVTATASCPTGYLATDGSVRLDAVDQGTGTFADAVVLASGATADGRGWAGTVRNTATGQIQGKVTVVCLSQRTTSGESHQHPVAVAGPVSDARTLGAGTWDIDLACGDDTVAVAPSYSFAAGEGVVRAAVRNGSGWRFTVDVPDSARVETSLRCLSTSLGVAQGHHHDLPLRQVSDTVSVPPGATTQLQLTCGDLEKGIVASYDLDDGLVSLGNDPQPKIRVFRFDNPTSAALTARVGLLCLGTATGPESVLREVTNTASVSTSSPDRSTSDDVSSATFRISGADARAPISAAAVATVAAKGAARVEVSISSDVRRTATVTLRTQRRAAGLRAGTVVARGTTTLRRGSNDVVVRATRRTAAVVRQGRIDRVRMVVTTRDGERLVRTVRLR